MAANNSYSKITPDIERLANKCSENTIATDLYTEYDVKRGLRFERQRRSCGTDPHFEIISSKTVDGKTVPVDGELYYHRGIARQRSYTGEKKSMHCGLKGTYLLLFGSLPNRTELADFRELLADSQDPACRRISSEM